ncbi:triadin-like [Abrus precatorius]|uniref:Triadin-like n=1 Tax=Abrus precatorius TaxID=3816 RepID=A0A8B8LK88_ABRPR|nr:triadin-like [Abrus precatorius]
MAFRPRTPTFRSQPSSRSVYEVMQPRSETKETPEAYLLHVYIPGFSRDSVKITYVESSRMVRITGERRIHGNRWSKFDQSYPIPVDSVAEKLQGKFEIGTLIITMPKVTPQVDPKQPEIETTQEKGVTEPKPYEKGQETIPSQPTTTKVEEPIEDKKSASLPSPVKEPADLKAQTATREDTSSQIPPDPIKDYISRKGQEEDVERSTEIGKPQKGRDEVEPKPTMAAKIQADEEPQKGQEEFEPKPTPAMTTKMQPDEEPQKGQEEFEPKPTPAMTTKMQPNEEPQKSQEEFGPKSAPTMATKIKTNEKPQKGQDEGEPKPTPSTVTRKPTDIGVKTTLSTVQKQLEEKKIEGTGAKYEETERISRKEVKEEDNGKPSESRNPVKDKEKGSFKEKETMAKKLSSKVAESSAPKVPKKEKESRTAPKKEEKSKEDTRDTEKNGIRELACAASQVVTRITEGKWNEQEKHLATNIGAAVLVIAALGAYREKNGEFEKATRRVKRVLSEGIGLVVFRWSALQTVVENEWGGHQSRLKAHQLALTYFHGSLNPKIVNDDEDGDDDENIIGDNNTSYMNVDIPTSELNTNSVNMQVNGPLPEVAAYAIEI